MASKAKRATTNDSPAVKRITPVELTEADLVPDGEVDSKHHVTPADAMGMKRGKPVDRPKGAGAHVAGHKRTGTTRRGRATVNARGGKARTRKR